MKQIVIAVFTVLAFFLLPSISVACTSFAVYSDQTIYGMNFDYTSDVRRMFSISTGTQGKIFHFRPYGFGDMAGMNNKGLFVTCHGLTPAGKPPSTRSKEHISTWIFHQMVLSRFEQVPQVKAFLNQRKVVQSIGTSMHNLVADRFGDAIVVEAGGTENQITGIQDRYIVMSNFPNYQLIGKSYEDADGDGAERFKIAHQYIRSNFRDFDIEKDFEMLKLAKNKSELYATRCSMVFDPQKKEIYISREANFDKIWKVSLENQTIETYRGFASFKRQPIPAEGLLATELDRW
jgi:hypothetical protein